MKPRQGGNNTDKTTTRSASYSLRATGGPQRITYYINLSFIPWCAYFLNTPNTAVVLNESKTKTVAVRERRAQPPLYSGSFTLCRAVVDVILFIIEYIYSTRFFSNP